MGFGGSAAAMIQSIRNNQKQLSKRVGYFDKDVNDNQEIYGKLDDHKKMSPAQFMAFQQKLREESARSRKKTLLIFSVIMSVVLSVVGYFLYI